MPNKIITIIGARPQFIKAACLSRLLKNHSKINEILLHTGQHYDENMSQVFFNELEIPKPVYNLEIGSGPQGQQTGKMLAGIEEVLLKEKPDCVIIYGDTNSTLAGALAAAKLHIPVAHIEAGLRSFNRLMPEEVNRLVADQLAELLFVPTKQGVINLQREGVPTERIHEVGDVMYDVALYMGAKAEQQSQILNKLHLAPKQYILATIHRAENTDDPKRLQAIFAGFESIAKDIQIVLPLHPRTRKMLQEFHITEHLSPNLLLIDPVGFMDMVKLVKQAAAIITDSGGVQKEAFFYHVPCVTLRDETEWVELVELGWNQIVPPVNANQIVKAIHKAMQTQGNKQAKPYGDGQAAQKIIKVLEQQFD